MKNQFEATILASPTLLLERLFKRSSVDNTELSISVNDKFGNTYSGQVINFDTKIGILQLLDNNNENSLFFVSIEHIISLQLFKCIDHIQALTGRMNTQITEEDSAFDIDAYIESLQEMLKENCDLEYTFKLNSTRLNQALTLQNIKSVLQQMGDFIVQTAKDDFGLEMLSSLSSFELTDIEDKAFSFKRDSTVIHIGLDFSAQLPLKITSLIDNGFNKVL